MTTIVIARILFGGFFMVMGFDHFSRLKLMTPWTATKNVPRPKLAVVSTGLLIIFCGLSLVLGVYVRLAAILLMFFLVIITPIMHNFWAIEDPMQKMSEMHHFLKNLALIGGLLLTFAIPEPWYWSLFGTVQ